MLPVSATSHTSFDTLQHTATHCNTLQHTATHCNTLLHTATHCNTARIMVCGGKRHTLLQITPHTHSHTYTHKCTPTYTHLHNCNNHLQVVAPTNDTSWGDPTHTHPPTYTHRHNGSSFLNRTQTRMMACGGRRHLLWCNTLQHTDLCILSYTYTHTDTQTGTPTYTHRKPLLQLPATHLTPVGGLQSGVPL